MTTHELYEEPDAATTEAKRRFPFSPSHRDAFIKGAQWILTWNSRNPPVSKPVCTCKNSSFGMDVDRCPVHGEGSA